MALNTKQTTIKIKGEFYTDEFYKAEKNGTLTEDMNIAEKKEITIRLQTVNSLIAAEIATESITSGEYGKFSSGTQIIKSCISRGAIVSPNNLIEQLERAVESATVFEVIKELNLFLNSPFIYVFKKNTAKSQKSATCKDVSVGNNIK